VTIGALITWGVIALSAHHLLAFPWDISLLFGALVVVTGPTVIVPMLRTVRPNATVSSILRWEGIVIDPIGALLAVLVYEFILSTTLSEAGWASTLFVFGKVVGVGLILGFTSGYAMGEVLRRHLLPEYLHNLATLALVFGAFSFSNTLAHESGLLAVTVMGMVMANMRGVHMREILNFKESLSVLLISGLFILLAARIDFSQFALLGWNALIVLLVLQFIARPLAVLVSTAGSTLNWRERAILSWIGPRGIVAAAVSALFALRMEQAGYADASLLVPLTFAIIIGTVVLQSATASPLAKWLKVTEPEPTGFLMVGANSVARTIAQALRRHDIRVLLTDSNWENISAARMEGLPVYFGNPVSDHADRHLDLVGIGRVLGLSPQRELNIIASMRYKRDFGANRVYVLLTSQDKRSSDKHQVGLEHRGFTLFSEDMTYSKFASQLARGHEIRSTRLSEEFDFSAYRARSPECIPLFAIDHKGQLEAFVANGNMRPGAGWTVISLLPPASTAAVLTPEHR
jgi:NhaP-type Na+/H+ or K+/H+ antiporter